MNSCQITESVHHSKSLRNNVHEQYMLPTKPVDRNMAFFPCPLCEIYLIPEFYNKANKGPITLAKQYTPRLLQCNMDSYSRRAV